MIPPPGGTSWHDARLTPRQQVVAALVADGYSRREMAAMLAISPHTVREHVAHIAMRLDGPGTARGRICRYVRGQRDAALRAANQSTPTPWEKAS